MYATIHIDSDRTQSQSKLASTAINANTWYYLVYSFILSEGKDTLCSLFLNNAAEVSLHLMAGAFILDNAAYSNYIALRTDTSVSTFKQRWNGYIYDFLVYQYEHADTFTDHAATCDTACLAIDFMEYDVSGVATACPAGNCDDRSCVRDEC